MLRFAAILLTGAALAFGLWYFEPVIRAVVASQKPPVRSTEARTVQVSASAGTLVPKTAPAPQEPQIVEIRGTVIAIHELDRDGLKYIVAVVEGMDRKMDLPEFYRVVLPIEIGIQEAHIRFGDGTWRFVLTKFFTHDGLQHHWWEGGEYRREVNG